MFLLRRRRGGRWHLLQPWQRTARRSSSITRITTEVCKILQHGVTLSLQTLQFVFPDLCNAANRLHNLWNNVLRLYDNDLYSHLLAMDVLPTTFGTCWTKLLFSRQFQVDYLVLWDAIIATGFTLVDYVVVAMVTKLYLRTCLLHPHVLMVFFSFS